MGHLLLVLISCLPVLRLIIWVLLFGLGLLLNFPGIHLHCFLEELASGLTHCISSCFEYIVFSFNIDYNPCAIALGYVFIIFQVEGWFVYLHSVSEVGSLTFNVISVTPGESDHIVLVCLAYGKISC